MIRTAPSRFRLSILISQKAVIILDSILANLIEYDTQKNRSPAPYVMLFAARSGVEFGLPGLPLICRFELLRGLLGGMVDGNIP